MMGDDVQLRFGRWQEALADVERVDALIVDAPYSERTHAGHNAVVGDGPDAHIKTELAYHHFTADDVRAFVDAWKARVSGWMVSISDHVLAPVWEDAMRAAGRYAFAPLPFVETGSRVRQAGDGPACWTCWVVVSRPSTKEYARWGALNGAYIGPNGQKLVAGGKSLQLMRAIIRDYTRPGDLVCDAFAGGGTTLLAAAMEGRRAIGSECDKHHFEIAQKRLARGYTPPLFAE